MVLTVLASAALGSSVPQDDLFKQGGIIVNDKGAYTDYVRAAQLLRVTVASTLIGFDSVEDIHQQLASVKASPEDAWHRGPNIERLERALKRIGNINAKPTRLQYDRAVVSDFGPVWNLILRGNQKPLLAPRASMDSMTLFPEFASFRQLVKIAARKFRVELADGNGAAAVRTLKESVRFSHRFGDDTIIARLVGVACEAILHAEIEKNVHLLPEAGLTELIAEIRRGYPAEPAIITAFQGERIMLADALKEVVNAPDPKMEPFRSDPDDEDEAEEDKEWNEMMTRVLSMSRAGKERFAQNVQTRFTSRLQNQALLLRSPERNWPLAPEKVVAQDDEDRFLKMMSIEFHSVFQAEARARTQNRLAVLHLLARRYQWHHGEAPTALKAFASSEDVIDPLTGNPFVMETAEGRLVFKSKGHPILGEISYAKRAEPDPTGVRKRNP